MKENQRFYICKHCGNLIGMIFDAGVPIVCCGEPMQAMVPNQMDAAGEKHLPVVTVEGNLVKVDVGSVKHPMTEEHSIKWIYIETKHGGQRKFLLPGDEPNVTFALFHDEVYNVFSYCNLHGLWQARIVS